jgi:hypothetical protein
MAKPSFQTTHYELIADALRISKAPDDVIKQLIVLFRNDNENFRPEQFVHRCKNDI